MSNETWGIYCPPVVTFNTLVLPKKTPAQRHNDETARDQTRFSSQVLKLELQCSISHAIDQDLKEDMSTVLQDWAPTSLSRQKNNFHVRDRWAAEWDYAFFWKEYNLLYVTCEVFTVHLSFRELLSRHTLTCLLRYATQTICWNYAAFKIVRVKNSKK